MAAALGMRPIGMRRAVLGDEPCETWTLDRLPELAAASDALVVALPLTEDTRRIISAAVIAAMRPGAHFVNVGRGDLVDEPALVDALTAGRLGGAGLDVFVTEPLPAESPFWDLPNVILTPHNSANTQASGEDAAEIFLTNLALYARGRAARTTSAERPFCPSGSGPVGSISAEGRSDDALVTRAPLSLPSPTPTSPGIHSAPSGLPGRSPVPVTVCWAAKGGSGTTVVTATLALSCSTESLLVDLGGELPAMLGIERPTRPGRRRLADVGRRRLGRSTTCRRRSTAPPG